MLAIYRQERFLYHGSDIYGDIEEYEKEIQKQEEYVLLLKDELATREHVPRKSGARNERQRLAKKHKGGRRSHKKK